MLKPYIKVIRSKWQLHALRMRIGRVTHKPELASFAWVKACLQVLIRSIRAGGNVPERYQSGLLVAYRSECFTKEIPYDDD